MAFIYICQFLISCRYPPPTDINTHTQHTRTLRETNGRRPTELIELHAPQTKLFQFVYIAHNESSICIRDHIPYWSKRGKYFWFFSLDLCVHRGNYNYAG